MYQSSSSNQLIMDSSNTLNDDMNMEHYSSHPGLLALPMDTGAAAAASGAGGGNSGLAKGIASHCITILPETFVLSDDDFLCGRGSRCFNHKGNKMFRKLVEANLERYSAASTKYDKTGIICEIIHHVRSKSPHGGFVKQDLDTGRYYEVGDFHAREKTSQAFRDALQDQYKSSYVTRKKTRKLRNGGLPTTGSGGAGSCSSHGSNDHLAGMFLSHSMSAPAISFAKTRYERLELLHRHGLSNATFPSFVASTSMSNSSHGTSNTNSAMALLHHPFNSTNNMNIPMTMFSKDDQQHQFHQFQQQHLHQQQQQRSILDPGQAIEQRVNTLRALLGPANVVSNISVPDNRGNRSSGDASGPSARFESNTSSTVMSEKGEPASGTETPLEMDATLDGSSGLLDFQWLTDDGDEPSSSSAIVEVPSESTKTKSTKSPSSSSDPMNKEGTSMTQEGTSNDDDDDIDQVDNNNNDIIDLDVTDVDVTENKNDEDDDEDDEKLWNDQIRQIESPAKHHRGSLSHSIIGGYTMRTCPQLSSDTTASSATPTTITVHPAAADKRTSQMTLLVSTNYTDNTTNMINQQIPLPNQQSNQNQQQNYQQADFDHYLQQFHESNNNKDSIKDVDNSGTTVPLHKMLFPASSTTSASPDHQQQQQQSSTSTSSSNIKSPTNIQFMACGRPNLLLAKLRGATPTTEQQLQQDGQQQQQQAEQSSDRDERYHHTSRKRSAEMTSTERAATTGSVAPIIPTQRSATTIQNEFEKALSTTLTAMDLGYLNNTGNGSSHGTSNNSTSRNPNTNNRTNEADDDCLLFERLLQLTTQNSSPSSSFQNHRSFHNSRNVAITTSDPSSPNTSYNPGFDLEPNPLP